MIFVEEEKKIGTQLTFLVSGNAANFLPEEVSIACAYKVSEALTGHLSTMLQYSPNEILDSIKKGWTVMALGEDFQTVGFAQFWEYGINKKGQQILEFGSWLSFRDGVGEKVFTEAISLGKKINPTAQLIAIVEQENLKAQAILTKVGAEEIGTKFSPVIRTVEGEAAFMKIFQISHNIELSEKEARIKQKSSDFMTIDSEIEHFVSKSMRIPEETFQKHRMLDYWLAVNYPKWKSRYGYPSGI